MVTRAVARIGTGGYVYLTASKATRHLVSLPLTRSSPGGQVATSETSINVVASSRTSKDFVFRATAAQSSATRREVAATSGEPAGFRSASPSASTAPNTSPQLSRVSPCRGECSSPVVSTGTRDVVRLPEESGYRALSVAGESIGVVRERPVKTVTRIEEARETERQ